MSRSLIVIATIALASLCGGAGAAQPPAMPRHNGGGSGDRMTMPPLRRADVPAMLSAQFAAIDANRDGAITEAEVRAYRRSRFEAFRAQERDRRFAMLDTDHDDRLSRQEYDAPARPGRMDPRAPDGAAPPPGGPAGDPRPAGPAGGAFGMMLMSPRWFEMADANQDGRVTLAEARMATLAMFDKADANHDGVVDHDEMRAAMMAVRPGGDGPRGPGLGHGEGSGAPGGDMPPPPPPGA